MITAVDSNVLFSILLSEPGLADAALDTIREAAAQGPIVACPVVYAEVAAGFADPTTVEAFLELYRVDLDPFDPNSLRLAAEAWRAYTRARSPGVACTRCGDQFVASCPACGAPLRRRQHVIPDFLVGAHAAARADALLTRDTGYFQRYFPRLQLWLPGGPSPLGPSL